jgi:hypothetical protein
MPILKDISASSINADDPQKQIEAVVKQLNEWARAISNEDRTRIMKSDSGIEALTIGQMPIGGSGILLKDQDDVNRMIFGQLPDDDIGLVISKPGVDVQDVFD